MKLRVRDLWVTLLVTAIFVPYVSYLVTGEMPSWVGTLGGMAFVGLVLGSVAMLADTSGDLLDRPARVEEALAVGAFVIGMFALLLSESALAEVLLSVFMGSILVVWAVEMADHAGLTQWHDAHRARRA